MEPLVGGRMETVAHRPITDPGDRFRLAILAVVAVAVHGWLLSHTFVTARDGVGFARYALQIGHPSELPPLPPAPPDQPRTLREVFKRGQHPPGFPLAVYVTSQAVRLVYHPGGLHELQDQMLFATQLTAAIGGVLLVFPMYWLGRSLFGKFAGFAGTLLFQVLPVPAHVTSDGLTEGVYLFVLATALLLAVRAIGTPTVGRFLQCGLATGVAYMVRPEGLFAGIACGIVAVGMVYARRWSARATAGWLTAFGVGAILTSAPYMLMIGGITNKPSVNSIFEKIVPMRKLILNEWDKQKSETPSTHGPIFGAWIPPEAEGAVRVTYVVKAIVSESLKGIHYAPIIWVVFGVGSVIGRLRGDPRLWVPILFAGMSLSVLLMLGYDKEYVSERHTLPLVFIGCLLAAAGLEPAGRWATQKRWLKDLMAVVGGPRIASALVLAALVLTALPGALKPLHEHRIGHKYAGEFLARNADPADSIYDPYEWAKFYCGRAVYTIPADPEPPRLRWAVDERDDGKVSHTKLPERENVQKVKADGRTVVAYSWPEGVPPSEAEVVVYKLDDTK